MTTHVFRARTLDEAREMAQRSLGQSPVILMTRRVRRDGIGGFLGGTDIEIVTSTQEALNDLPVAKAPTQRSNAAQQPRANSASNLFAGGVYKDAVAAAAAEGARNPTGVNVPSSGTTGRPPASAQDVASTTTTVNNAEIASLRAEMRALRTAVSATPAPSPVNEVAVSPSMLDELAAVREVVASLAPTAKRNDRVSNLLRARGIEGVAANHIAKSIKGDVDEDAPVREKVRDALAEMVRATAWPLSGQGRVMIALVGPTGVGKTTTAAKLAARARMDGRSITLVACDAFRVGAVDQLRRYAELLDARFVVATSRAELLNAMGSARTDVVIVDTAGRTPSPNGVEAGLASEVFDKAPECRGYERHVLLCMQASLRAVDASRLVRAFSVAGPSAIAITKLDETDTPSGIAHGAVTAKRPVSVLCFGQRVPEDIAPATSAALLDHLVPRPLTTVMNS